MGVLLMTYSAGVAAGALIAGWFFDMFGVQDCSAWRRPCWSDAKWRDPA
jgi:hypothetical protein